MKRALRTAIRRVLRIPFLSWAPYSGPRRAQRACEEAARGVGVPASDRAGVRGRAPVWLLFGLGVVLIACSSVQPVPIKHGATCYRCRRPIEDLKMAAEIIDQNHQVYTYRTAGCMAKYLTEHAEENPLAVFVTDSVSGKMLNATSALYVRATVDPRTSERDFVAFSNVQQAVAFARDNNGSAIDWAAVMAHTRSAKGD
ncbi:MAG: nitrous oxide reductase accessory protein NosL [Acidobacteria bacterium]|nr:nitrous oxide reductase accessory protein NosL [Acidobacteriota bacterium]